MQNVNRRRRKLPPPPASALLKENNLSQNNSIRTALGSGIGAVLYRKKQFDAFNRVQLCLWQTDEKSCIMTLNAH